MSFIVKNTTFVSLLDLIAPHSCRGCGRLGDILCDCCKNNINQQTFNHQPKNLPKNFPPIFIVGKHTSLLKTLIQDFKYNSTRALAPKLAKLLDEALPPLSTNSVIIPLPTISKHIRSRGLDHTLLLAKHLAKIRHLKVKKILIRNKNTIQVGSDRKTRLAQANSAYSVSKKIKINPEVTYILLDDVWTTGASMKSAVKKLQQAGARKIMIALLTAGNTN